MQNASEKVDFNYKFNPSRFIHRQLNSYSCYLFTNVVRANSLPHCT